MGVTSSELQKLGIVDATIEEPKGGAHRDIDMAAQSIKSHLVAQLAQLKELPIDELLDRRYQRLMSYGND